MIENSCIIITGSTGLLGSHLLSFLLEKGYKVICPVRKLSKKLPHLSQKNCTYLSYTTFLESSTFTECSEITLIHCAGLVSYQQKDKDALYEVNKGLTDKVAQWALNAKVSKFIYISSISALAKNKIDDFIYEDSVDDPNLFTTNYGKSKRAGEDIVKKYGHRGLPWIILNPSVIIGPAPLEKSSATLFKYIYDEKPFYTEGLMNFVDIRDLAEIIHRLNDSDLIQQQFIINGGAKSYKDFFTIIANKMKANAPSIKIPKKLVIAGAILEYVFSKLTRKDPTLSLETAKMAGNRYVYKSEKLTKELNFKFRDLDDSVNYTVDEMKKRGYFDR